MSNEIFNFKEAFEYNAIAPKELSEYLDKDLYVEAGDRIIKKFIIFMINTIFQK